MSSVEPVPLQRGSDSPIVASEFGSARLEGAEPDAEIVALAESFAAGDLSEADFDAAVRQHQQALVAESRQRLFVAGR